MWFPAVKMSKPHNCPFQHIFNNPTWLCPTLLIALSISFSLLLEGDICIACSKSQPMCCPSTIYSWKCSTWKHIRMYNSSWVSSGLLLEFYCDCFILYTPQLNSSGCIPQLGLMSSSQYAQVLSSKPVETCKQIQFSQYHLSLQPRSLKL